MTVDTSANSADPADPSTSSDTAASDTTGAAWRPLSPAERFCVRAAVIFGLVLLAWQLYGVIAHFLDNYLLDVGVFRDAGRAILEDGGLYGDDFDSRSGFAFIYPPIAAGLFVPLTWLSEPVMEATWTVASLAAAWAVLAMAAHRLRLPRPVLLAFPLLGLALCLEPLQTHLMYGQINVFLVFLVTADLLGFTPRWMRGAGVGLAAGIKITPAAFALAFLVTKRWGDLARSAGTFFLTVAIGWVMRPDESLYYWTDEFFNGDRGGPPEYEANQALTGLLTRAGVHGDLAQTIMIPGLLVIAAITAFAAARLLRAGRPVTTLLLLILAVGVAAPISVTHHWTGIIVAAVLLVALLRDAVAGRGTDWITFAGVVVLLAVNILPDNALSGDTLYRAFEQQWFLSNLQGIAGVVCLLLLLVTAWRLRPAPAERKFYEEAPATPVRELSVAE